MNHILVLILFLLPFFPSPGHARNVSLTPLEKMIQQIEKNAGSWTALKADVMMDFLIEKESKASCEGKLTYDRLDEKILLNCFDRQNQLVFSFKTDDRNFELYLPSQETIFSGNIFDLQDSPDIEAHLKPLDLYRALKPIAIPTGQSEIENWGRDTVTLKIFGKKRFSPYLSRRLFTTETGNVFKEIFYSFEEKPTVTIYRSRFHQFLIQDSRYRAKVLYPRLIEIESHALRKSIQMQFEQIQFFSLLGDEAWQVSHDPDAMEVFLDDPLATATA